MLSTLREVSHHMFRSGNPTSGLPVICMLLLGIRNRSQVFGIVSAVRFGPRVLCKQGIRLLFVSWLIPFHRELGMITVVAFVLMVKVQRTYHR